MQRINALLRTVGIVGVCGLAALALPRPAHAGGVHVSLGFGLPVPVFVAPPPPVVYPAPPVYVYPAPVSSNTPRSWCNHRWCMDSPTLEATPPTGAMGGPGDTAIMTTATMQRIDNTGAPTAGTAGAASNEEEEA